MRKPWWIFGALATCLWASVTPAQDYFGVRTGENLPSEGGFFSDMSGGDWMGTAFQLGVGLGASQAERGRFAHKNRGCGKDQESIQRISATFGTGPVRVPAQLVGHPGYQYAYCGLDLCNINTHVLCWKKLGDNPLPGSASETPAPYHQPPPSLSYPGFPLENPNAYPGQPPTPQPSPGGSAWPKPPLQSPVDRNIIAQDPNQQSDAGPPFSLWTEQHDSLPGSGYVPAYPKPAKAPDGPSTKKLKTAASKQQVTGQKQAPKTDQPPTRPPLKAATTTQAPAKPQPPSPPSYAGTYQLMIPAPSDLLSADTNCVGKMATLQIKIFDTHPGKGEGVPLVYTPPQQGKLLNRLDAKQNTYLHFFTQTYGYFTKVKGQGGRYQVTYLVDRHGLEYDFGPAANPARAHDPRYTFVGGPLPVSLKYLPAQP